jgi:hypothetical protein
MQRRLAQTSATLADVQRLLPKRHQVLMKIRRTLADLIVRLATMHAMLPSVSASLFAVQRVPASGLPG